MKTNAEIAKNATQAAVAEAVSEAAKPAEPAAPKFPPLIQLSEFERIKAENLNLRMQLIDSQYQSARKAILDEDRAWTAAVGAAHGVDLTKYMIDFSNGTCVYTNGRNPAQPPQAAPEPAAAEPAKAN